MRHRVKGKKLGRTASHRAALLNSLATSLLKHKRIKTTLAKAKEARSYVESLITKAKKGDLHNQRQIMSVINDKEVVKELFAEIVKKVGDRPGGYTRVVKLGSRKGDAARMAIIELVDYNDVINKAAEDKRDAKEEKLSKKEKAAKDKEQVEEETDKKVKQSKKAKEVTDENVEEAKVVEEKPRKKVKDVKETTKKKTKPKKSK
ncbi:MAG: 50S ribosomal protein L17 [Ignavibacteriales bacterium CG_4_9_14_3_um_filter_30_11]|nr:MAG: 50S ribosomal protein L17 [Ignavibacteriales bacterium CG_4_9_14_3_um_filter_30_11]